MPLLQSSHLTLTVRYSSKLSVPSPKQEAYFHIIPPCACVKLCYSSAPSTSSNNWLDHIPSVPRTKLCSRRAKGPFLAGIHCRVSLNLRAGTYCSTPCCMVIETTEDHNAKAHLRLLFPLLNWFYLSSLHYLAYAVWLLQPQPFYLIVHYSNFVK
jgi:hypothetical protein